MHVLALVVGASLLAGQLPDLGLPSAAAPVDKPAAKSAVGPCASPKAAVLNWLGDLQAGQYNEARAALCAVPPEGMSEEELREAHVRLKRVFDARGIYVRVDDLSEDPDYIDPATGLRRVPVSRLMPDVFVVKSGERWVLSRSTLDRVDALYQETFPLDLSGLVKRLPAWTKVPALGITLWQVTTLALLVLLGFIARLVIASVVTTQVLRVFDRLGVPWGRDLIRGNALPLGTLALAGVVGLGVSSLGLSVGWAKLSLLGVRVTAAVSVVMLLYRLVDVVAAWMAHRAAQTETKLDDQLVPLVRRGLRIITVLAGVVFVLQNLEVNVGSLLATLGIGTLAFALAAQDTVKNLFGSITIFLDKPFQIGDWVVTSGVEGIIHEVGFRSTRIRTFYDSIVTVPNGKFTDAVIDNYGMRTYRRCFTTLSLTYDTTPEQIEAFCDGARAIIKAHPLTRKDYYEVHFSGYGESGLNVMLYFFFKVSSWSEELRSRHEVFLDLWRLARDVGVSYAFPTRTLHLDTQAAPSPRSPPTRPDLEELRAAVSSFGPGGSSVVPPGPRVTAGFYAGPGNPTVKKGTTQEVDA
jgi:MscS family membrane protein